MVYIKCIRKYASFLFKKTIKARSACTFLLPKEVWQLRKGGNVLVNGHGRHQNNKLLENKLSKEKGKHW